MSAYRFVLTLAFLLVCSSGSIQAEEVDKTQALFVVRRTGIGNDDFKSLSDQIQLVATFPDSNAVAIHTSLTPDEIIKQFGPKAAVYREDPFVVSLFGGYDTGPGCEGPDSIPSQAVTPDNVCRVNGPQSAGTAVDPARTPAVWIVDSGLDQTVIKKNLVHYNLLIDCTGASCKDLTSTPSQMDDKLGHGTMIAGIIGGKAGSGGEGVFGISPDVRVNVVRVFDASPNANFWAAPHAGLNWIRSNAQAKPGDIVNVSWGAKWTAAARKKDFDGLDLVSQDIHGLADRGLSVVVASGNLVAGDPSPLWYGFVIPANSGGYKSATGGSVYAVGGVRITPGSGAWSDDFWPFGVYGTSDVSATAPSVQSYLEPGVDVVSLWTSKVNPRINTCSGTSFSAAAFSGLLVRSPDANGIKVAFANANPAGQVKQVGYITDNSGARCP